MERNEKNLLRRSAENGNMISMVLSLLTAIVALSVGLGFFFLVTTNVGYGVGIAMFVLASIVFVLGELQYFVNLGKLRHND